jgi:ribosome modulation factor
MSKSFESAKRKGFLAGLQGKSIDECPYEDLRAGKYNNVVTWSRGFIRAWIDGWENGKRRRGEITKKCSHCLFALFTPQGVECVFTPEPLDKSGNCIKYKKRRAAKT